MRSRAVIPAAALVWLISIEGAAARLDILVDKTTQRMLVIQDGYLRYMWPVSTGRDNMATPNGLYAPERLERNWFSRAYYNSPMPYSIFFHNGYAIHGSYAINQLGGPASHGCVRLHPYHAALLFDLVQHEGPEQTTIEVTEERPQQPPLPAREISPGQGRNWPTAARNPLPPSRRMPIVFRPPADLPRASGRAANHFVLREDPPAEVTDEGLPPERPLPRREIVPGPGGNRSIAGRNPWPPSRRMPIVFRPPADLPRASGGAANHFVLRDDPPVEVTGGLPPERPLPRRELVPGPGGNRSIAGRNPWPPSRRMLTDFGPPPNVPRAPIGAASHAPRPAVEPPDPRPKPKIAEASPPEPAQQAGPVSAFKLLPASCWSGGASRWRWWTSSKEAPCK